MKKAIVFMATGFEEMELTISVDMLRRAGIETRTVSLADDLEPVEGSRGIKMLPDATIDQVDFKELDVLVLPGGLDGTNNMGDDERVLKMLRDAKAAGKKLAAICAAPLVLLKAGVAEGCTVSAHPEAKEHITGAKYSEDRVVVDGNIITSRAAGTTFEFVLTIISELLGKEAATAANEGVLARI